MSDTKKVQYTDASTIPQIVQGLRNACKTGTFIPIERRKEILSRLFDVLVKLESEICEALFKDLKKVFVSCLIERKDYPTAYSTELILTKNEIVDVLENLDDWASPKNTDKDWILNALDKCQVRSQPLGVVCVIAPWNYPFLLTVSPLVSAIGAGNYVVIKPSEISAHTSTVLTKIVDMLDVEELKIVNGGVTETQILLEQRFDLIFYTGNSTVAKIIMKAASKYLTPVVLELGGKSPVILDSNIDIDVAATRIMWAKTSNAGQICIAPDHVFCPKDLVPRFVEACKNAVKRMFGEDISKAEHYSRIISANHFKRLTAILNAQKDFTKTKLEFGGQTEEKDLFIAPTIFTGLVLEDLEKNPVMCQEIFGPILPIIAIESTADALSYINKGEKPLCLYVFSKNSNYCNEVIESTSSGSVVANDLLMNMTVNTLPFGGVGESGMGNYHGKFGFDCFSHKRAVMLRPHGWEVINKPRYPPMERKTLTLMKSLFEKKKPSNGFLSMIRKRISFKFLFYIVSLGAFFFLGTFTSKIV